MIGHQAKRMADKLRANLKDISGPHFCVINDQVLEFITELEKIDGVVTVPTTEVPDGHCYFYCNQAGADEFIEALRHLRELGVPWEMVDAELKRKTEQMLQLK